MGWSSSNILIHFGSRSRGFHDLYYTQFFRLLAITFVFGFGGKVGLIYVALGRKVLPRSSHAATSSLKYFLSVCNFYFFLFLSIFCVILVILVFSVYFMAITCFSCLGCLFVSLPSPSLNSLFASVLKTPNYALCIQRIYVFPEHWDIML